MKRLLFITLVVAMFVSCSTQTAITPAQYTQSVQKDIPFSVAELKPVKSEVYSFRCDGYIGMLPDYEIDEDGVIMGYRTTFAPTHATQTSKIIWRNIVISKRNKRVLCIDRLLNNGNTFGYVYVIQGEDKSYPDGYHWDVTDQRLMIGVADILENYTDLSVELLKSVSNINR